jgi:hypothetical protein
MMKIITAIASAHHGREEEWLVTCPVIVVAECCQAEDRTEERKEMMMLGIIMEVEKYGKLEPESSMRNSNRHCGDVASFSS